MIIIYSCECCQKIYPTKQKCIEHEKACKKAESICELFEDIPKEINVGNIDVARDDVANILVRLNEIKNYFDSFYCADNIGEKETFFIK